MTDVSDNFASIVLAAINLANVIVSTMNRKKLQRLERTIADRRKSAAPKRQRRSRAGGVGRKQQQLSCLMPPRGGNKQQQQLSFPRPAAPPGKISEENPTGKEVKNHGESNS
jgi:hypothetical protein